MKEIIEKRFIYIYKKINKNKNKSLPFENNDFLTEAMKPISDVMLNTLETLINEIETLDLIFFPFLLKFNKYFFIIIIILIIFLILKK
jgi:hypothetical protein